jgi:antitoxin component YwqK of YwqJK toxin-antitoxin module
MGFLRKGVAIMVVSVPTLLIRLSCGFVVCLGCAGAIAGDSPRLVMAVPNDLASTAPQASTFDAPTALDAPFPSNQSRSGAAALPSTDSTSANSTTADKAKSAVEMVTERYADGTVHIERQVAQDDQGNYINHGSYTEYDARGVIIRKGEYRNGKQQGLWTRHFDTGEGDLFSDDQDRFFTGPYISEASFADGQLNGTWVIRSRAQRKIIEFSFENGTRSGSSTWWYPSGEKRREVTYKDGKPVGELHEFDDHGNLYRKATFVDGRVLMHKVDRYASGQKYYEGWVLLPGTDGSVTFDWWNGTAEAAAGSDTRGEQKHGLWTAWYPNGQKEAEGEYREDVPTGKFVWWYENGQKQAEGTYAEGQENGTWITWHSNGLKESQAEYLAGQLSGKWLSWKDDGQLNEIHDFAQDGNGPQMREKVILPARNRTLGKAGAPGVKVKVTTTANSRNQNNGQLPSTGNESLR